MADRAVTESASAGAYRAAGVDLDHKAAVSAMIGAAVSGKVDSRLLAGIGAFSGLLQLPPLREPVIGATVDSVGTKLKIASALNRHEATARDIVNHCVNDVLCSGLEPVAFLDYIGIHRLDDAVIAAIIEGARDACEAAGCVLLGGETAEMPDVYAPGDYDLAGCVIGAGERSHVIDGSKIRPGDAVIGLASTGLHTNGYTLARRLIAEAEYGVWSEALGTTYGEALLAEHRSYLAPVRALKATVEVLGLAHITGGGLFDNLPRCLPAGLGVRLQAGAWPVPGILQVLRSRGGLGDAELARTFNAGIGMGVVVHPTDFAEALRLVPDAYEIGEVVASDVGPRVTLEGRLP